MTDIPQTLQDQEIFAVTLILRDDDQNTGWHLAGTANDRKFSGPIPVVAAREIARAIMETAPMEAEVTPFEIVQEGTEALRTRIANLLTRAQEWASLQPSLEERLKEFQ